MAAGSGDTASKYVARRETPLYIPENCTQCMECIAVCPDTALPNCSQDLDTLLRTAVTNYVEDPPSAQKMLGLMPEIEKRTRELMRDTVAKSTGTPLPQLHPAGHPRGERLLRRRQDAVLRRHRQDADGVPEDERDLRDAREEEARRRRHLLDLRVGSLQGMRGLRHGVRRARCAADGAGDRGGQRRARDRHRVPGPAARHAAEVSRPLQRLAAAGLEDRHAAQHADGAPQLRRARLGRRRVRRLRREEHPARRARR